MDVGNANQATIMHGLEMGRIGTKGEHKHRRNVQNNISVIRDGNDRYLSLLLLEAGEAW